MTIDLKRTTSEYLVRFDGDDMVCEQRVEPGTFRVIYRIAHACLGCVAACSDEIEWCQLYAEEDYGGPLPWRFPDPEMKGNLICRTGELIHWARSLSC